MFLLREEFNNEPTVEGFSSESEAFYELSVLTLESAEEIHAAEMELLQEEAHAYIEGNGVVNEGAMDKIKGTASKVWEAIVKFAKDAIAWIVRTWTTFATKAGRAKAKVAEADNASVKDEKKDETISIVDWNKVQSAIHSNKMDSETFKAEVTKALEEKAEFKVSEAVNKASGLIKTGEAFTGYLKNVKAEIAKLEGEAKSAKDNADKLKEIKEKQVILSKKLSNCAFVTSLAGRCFNDAIKLSNTVLSNSEKKKK